MLYDKDIREPLFDFLDDIYLTNIEYHRKRGSGRYENGIQVCRNGYPLSACPYQNGDCEGEGSA